MNTTDNKLDFTKPVQTRDGREVRIFTTEGRSDRPVIGEIKTDDEWNNCFWDSLGRYTAPQENPTDLINVPQKHVRWINIYRDRSPSLHCDRDKADNAAICSGHITRIACIKIEFQEGEGL